MSKELEALERFERDIECGLKEQIWFPPLETFVPLNKEQINQDLKTIEQALQRNELMKPIDIVDEWDDLEGKCRNCGAYVTSRNKFCGNCGQKLDWER